MYNQRPYQDRPSGGHSSQRYQDRPSGGHSSQRYQPESGYGDRSNPQRDRDHFYRSDRERDYPINSERKYSFATSGGCAKNEDRFYRSNQNREYSGSSQERNYSYQDRSYSTRENADFKSNQNVMCSSSAGSNNMFEEQTFNRFNNTYQQPRNDRFSLGNAQGKQIRNFPQGGRFEEQRETTLRGSDRGYNSNQSIQRKNDCNEEVDSQFEKHEVPNEYEHEVSIKSKNKINMDEEEDEDEYNGDEEVPDKPNAFIPDKKLVEKYKYFPPSAEEIGEIFNGMVIYFFYKVKDCPEKNPFVIICESFRRSDRFGPLSIEDGYQQGNKTTKFCTMRWNGMMMVRGVGRSGKFKEPRVAAGVELITQFVKTCYSLLMKDSYYGKAAVTSYIENNTWPNTVKVVGQGEVPTPERAQTFITDFFKDNNDFELMFKNTNYNAKIKQWAKHKGYEVRFCEKLNTLGVSIKRTPQYWRDKILASGQMENERFKLIPPLGLEADPLNDPVISHLMERSTFGFSLTERVLYAHKDAGLGISKCLPPWRSGRKGFYCSKKNRHTMNRIGRFIQEGDQTKLKSVLSKPLKKKVRQQINKRFGLNLKI